MFRFYYQPIKINESEPLKLSPQLHDTWTVEHMTWTCLSVFFLSRPYCCSSPSVSRSTSLSVCTLCLCVSVSLCLLLRQFFSSHPRIISLFSFCLSFYLFACIYDSPSFSLSVCLSVFLSVFLSVCLSFCLSENLIEWWTARSQNSKFTGGPWLRGSKSSGISIKRALIGD